MKIPRILSGMFMALAIASLGSGRSVSHSPTLILFNGQIVTMEEHVPQAEAIAVENDTIIAIGSTEEILRLKAGNTKMIDLKGQTVLPGFIDPHSHWFVMANESGFTFEQAQQMAIENGLTSVSEMFVDHFWLPQLLDFDRQGKLKLRVNLYLVYDTACGDLNGYQGPGLPPKPLGTWYRQFRPHEQLGRRLRMGGVKIYADGGSCGSPAMSQPYTADPSTSGDLWLTQSQMNEAVAGAQAGGYQIAIHAIGDRAIEVAQNAIAHALEGQPNNYRHMILHNSYIRPDLLPRYGDLGIMALIEAPWPCTNRYEALTQWLGEERANWYKRWRDLLDQGIHVAADTDWIYSIVGPINPMERLHRLVTGIQVEEDGTVCFPPAALADQVVTVEEALRMMTIEGAYATFEEAIKGSLKPGKLADLVVLSGNPLTTPIEQVRDIKVMMTIIGGQIEYQRTTEPEASPGAGTRLSSQEQRLLDLVSGEEAYGLAQELERIGLRHPAFRSGGSAGALEAADWLVAQFQTLELPVEREAFEFYTWDLVDWPTLVADDDGNFNTQGDQISINSFSPVHLSKPTPPGGVAADLVVLPLPEGISSYGQLTTSGAFLPDWEKINIAQKIVLVGYEVMWNERWRQAFAEKVRAERPRGVILTWWYEWMSFAPPFFGSVFGRRADWRETPFGWVTYEDGLSLRRLEGQKDISARMVIDALVGQGSHYNVVARLEGADPSKQIIVSGHYDTVPVPGFSDNSTGAAGVLELARVFAQAKESGIYTPPYTLRFVNFTSEEFGLVGSYYYVLQHKDELENIVAVINLDTLGSDRLEYTTSASQLDELVGEAARAFAVDATTTEGGSDHISFDRPWEANEFVHSLWADTAVGTIADALPRPGIMIVSYPYDIRQPERGWIHTTNDSSTTPGWVELDDLETQLRVAALTIIRAADVLGVVATHTESRILDSAEYRLIYDVDGTFLRLENVREPKNASNVAVTVRATVNGLESLIRDTVDIIDGKSTKDIKLGTLFDAIRVLEVQLEYVPSTTAAGGEFGACETVIEAHFEPGESWRNLPGDCSIQEEADGNHALSVSHGEKMGQGLYLAEVNSNDAVLQGNFKVISGGGWVQFSGGEDKDGWFDDVIVLREHEVSICTQRAGSPCIIPQHSSPPLRFDRWYAIKILIENKTRVRVYLDGAPLIDYSYPSPLRNLRFSLNAQENSHVLYDDVILSKC